MDTIDFVFDGERLSDYGMMIGYFGSEKTWSGGEITFTTTKTTDSDRQHFHTSSYDTPLSCTFSIVKKICNIESQDDFCINQEEFSSIMRWLCREDGYHWLQFDNEEYGDVYFNCYFTASPQFIAGDIVGFNLTMTTDSPYGYSKLYTHEFDFTSNNQKHKFINYSDKIGHISPKCTIVPKSSGSITIRSGIENNYVDTKLYNTIENSTIVLDEENDIYSGISPFDFNFVFPRISNSYYDRNTFIQRVDSGTGSHPQFHIKLEYRLIRKVVV